MKLTDEEMSTLNEYKGMGFDDINKYLYLGEKKFIQTKKQNYQKIINEKKQILKTLDKTSSDYKYHSEDIQELIENIKKIISTIIPNIKQQIENLNKIINTKGKTSKGMIVYRGIKGFKLPNGELKPFISTTTDLKIGEGFVSAWMKPNSCCLYRIYIAPGVKYFDFETFYKQDKSETLHEEKEILLPTNLWGYSTGEDKTYYTPISFKMPIYDYIICNKKDYKKIPKSVFPKDLPKVTTERMIFKQDIDKTWLLVFDLVVAINSNKDIKYKIKNGKSLYNVLKTFLPITEETADEYWKALSLIKIKYEK
jgi:hypothetical protein